MWSRGTSRGVCVALGLGAMLLGPAHSRPVECQTGSCVNEAVNVAPPTLDLHLLATTSCSADGLPENSTLVEYTSVRSGSSTNISQGGRTSVEGQYCNVKGWSGPNCVTFFTVNRNISVLNLREVAPNLSEVYFNLSNNPPFKQLLDSSIPGTTNGPRIWAADSEGTYAYKWWVTTTTTNCNIQPANHPEQTRQVNVWTCKPEWYMFQGVNLRAPLTNITLDVPIGFEDALDPAQDAASSMGPLLGLGITINVTYGQGCSGGACVTLNENHVNQPGETDCASLQHGSYSPSGVLNSPSAIQFLPTVWHDAHEDRLQRLITHELFHYFGLHNRLHSTCASSNTVMGPSPSPSCYSSAPIPQGALVGPSASDAGTVKYGTYGPQNRKICGW